MVVVAGVMVPEQIYCLLLLFTKYGDMSMPPLGRPSATLRLRSAPGACRRALSLAGRGPQSSRKTALSLWADRVPHLLLDTGVVSGHGFSRAEDGAILVLGFSP
jgi:hypothetical protein